MYKSEIKDLQDTMKKWQRFSAQCAYNIDAVCKHRLIAGCMCNMALCPGGFDEPKGTQFTADVEGPFIG